MEGFNQLYRYGKKLYRKHKKLAKFYQALLRIIYQCDISLNANIAEDVYFCHEGFGIVINSKARIRNGCCIQNGVVIGEKRAGGGAPLIKKNVFIGAHAIVLGDITIGENSVVGAGAVVVNDVPANSIVIGVPAHVVKTVKRK